VALLDMSQAEPLVPVADLVERLEGLEGRVRGGTGSKAPPRGPAQQPRPPTAPTVPARATPPAPPTPAPPKPPAAVPRPYQAPADPMAEWSRLVEVVSQRSLKLAGIYHTARLLSWTDRALELGASGTMASDPENVKELKRLVAEIAGAPLDIVVKADAPVSGARSLHEVEAEKREAERKKHEDEARAHPLTEKVVETFGAQIKEIKFDG
jgi:hypothetical protein